MARPELGSKRTCKHCRAKFYDLNRESPVCPLCGKAQRSARSAPVAVSSEEAALNEASSAFVSLEEADSDVTQTGKVTSGEDEIDISDDEDAFLDDGDDDDGVEGLIDKEVEEED